MISTFYTVEEVAAALKVDERTVRSMITKGTLRAIRVGRQYRIPDTQLKEMVDGR